MEKSVEEGCVGAKVFDVEVARCPSRVDLLLDLPTKIPIEQYVRNYPEYSIVDIWIRTKTVSFKMMADRGSILRPQNLEQYASFASEVNANILHGVKHLLYAPRLIPSHITW